MIPVKKTKEQRQLIRDNKMCPMFWTVITERTTHLLVVNTLTGEYRVLEK